LRAVRALLSRTGSVPVAQGEGGAPAGPQDEQLPDPDFICLSNQRRIYVNRDDERAMALVQAAGDFNPKSLAMWRSLVGEREWTHIVDVGANYGEMLVGVDLPRSANIIALEPCPYLFPCLSRTLRESGLDVEAVEAAASDHCGEVTININRTWSGKSSLIDGQLQSEGHVLERRTVRATTLDRLIPGSSEQAIRLLVKIDVEGHEAAVLRGLGRLLSEAEDFTALVEILHLPNEDLDWIVSRFSVELQDLRDNRLVLVGAKDALEVRDLLRDDRFYPQDVVLRRFAAATAVTSG
jgi:FkbM family methyltransferase